MASGLPDFSLYSMPKQEKIYQITTKYVHQNCHNIPRYAFPNLKKLTTEIEALKFWATSVIIGICTAQSNQSPIRQKFAQSGYIYISLYYIILLQSHHRWLPLFQA
jgi:hypothetical protein